MQPKYHSGRNGPFDFIRVSPEIPEIYSRFDVFDKWDWIFQFPPHHPGPARRKRVSDFCKEGALGGKEYVRGYE